MPVHEVLGYIVLVLVLIITGQLGAITIAETLKIDKALRAILRYTLWLILLGYIIASLIALCALVVFKPFV